MFDRLDWKMNSLEVMPKKTVPTTLIIDNPMSSVRLASLNVGTGKGWKGLNHVTLAVRHKENTMKNTQAFLCLLPPPLVIFLDTYEELNISKENTVYGDKTREKLHEYYIKLMIKVSVDG